jgi:hypothetical protein
MYYGQFRAHDTEHERVRACFRYKYIGLKINYFKTKH